MPNLPYLDRDLLLPAPAEDAVPALALEFTGEGFTEKATTACLAQETAVAMEFNGISHATMLATPADLEDFLVGFALTEGIIDKRSDIRDLSVSVQSLGVAIQAEISSACMARLKDRRRALAGRTGCGLCGVETLDGVERDVAALPDGAVIAATSVLHAMTALATHQPLHARTGAVHAAGWARADGELVLVREDVGRHNALDKLIGALASQDIDPSQGLCVISSRASFEMVQKAAAAGIPVLAAVSAPTARAQRLATEKNVTLLGFTRERRCTIYGPSHRLQWELAVNR